MDTLLRLLLHVREERPQVETVWCGSWLNELSAFLDLFPDDWRGSLESRGRCNGTWGWWGQYMDHRGFFHHRRAQVLRSTGRHPYVASSAHCALDDLVAHLRQQR